ncbi:unnamed protein product [Parnassius apollo]|uniref:(apollo) hypothetical protein n=1 Tax=Parnassius apollo TaxID=110799 RepID=A0A8S3WIQ9_PARAO|nr:unnamed protein product [Parnassius apollo]
MTEKDKNFKEKKQSKGKSVKRKVLNCSENSEDEDYLKNKKTKLAKERKRPKVSSKKCINSSKDSEDDIPIAQLCNDDEEYDVENRDICAVCQQFGRGRRIGYIKNVAENSLPKIS